MSEGTKLGEIQELSELNQQPEPTEDANLEATKIGEMSDFEKSLLEEDNLEKSSLEVEKSVENKTEEVQDTSNEIEKSDMEKLLEAEIENEIFDYQVGDIVDGVVRNAEKGGVLVDIKYKSDGFISNHELGINDNGQIEKLEEGQECKVFIEKLESREGYAILSRKKAQYEESWDTLTIASHDKSTVIIKVQSKVQGGLVASFKGIKGFVPASQVLMESKEDTLDRFVGETLEVAVLQVDRRRRKIIFSHRATQVDEKKVEKEKVLSELEVGQTREGVVTSIKDFGVFVDIGGVEGLVHISELSWSRVTHPTDYVDVGDEVNVFVLGVDKENQKISLGMKQLEPDPWVTVSQRYQVGQVVEGTITRLVTFGAFIQLEEKLEGLIHISEMSYDRIEKAEDVVKAGDTVKAKIIKLNTNDQKIGLTLKDTSETKTEELTETVSEESTEQQVETVSEDQDNQA